jgi:flagellar motor switch protein FliG
MALKGIQKAAMLLTSLDPATATEMLKGQPADIIQKIAMELSQMDAKGINDSEQATLIVRDFSVELQKRNSGVLHIKSFVGNLLQGSSGKEKGYELQAKLEKSVRDKDPFILISGATAPQLLAAVSGESPQTISLILSCVPPKLATEVLSRLDEQIGTQVAWRLTLPQEVSAKTLHRIGEMICKKLQELSSEQKAPVVQEDASKETLRRVAIVLSGLQKERRDVMLQQIQSRNAKTAETVKALMVTWDDIPKIDNKCLQGLLRKVEATVLAKALFGAESVVAQKIRSNLSERMAQMIDDETSLLGEPRKKDVLAAREEVTNPLRQANEAEELIFIEEG